MALALLFAALGGHNRVALADDWRAAIKVLRVGFVSAGSSSADLTRLEPFRAYLAAHAGIPVELVPAVDGASLVDAEVSGRVQYAIDSAVGYATAAARCACVEPLAEPAAADGSRGYYAILLARVESPIRDLAGAAGARVALSAADSVAGRLIPMKALAAAGVGPDSQVATTYESAGPDEAVAALLDGRADLAAAWSSLAGNVATGYSFGVLTREVADSHLAMDRVRVVWQSRPIPFGPHTVQSNLPAELKTLLLNALVAMATEAPDVLDAVDRSPSGGGGFVTITPEDYAPVAELVAPL